MPTRLRSRDKAELERLLRGVIQSVRVVLRGLALLQLARDQPGRAGGGERGAERTNDSQHRHGQQCAPRGAARWTVRLIAEEAVKRKVVPRVGRETIQILLQSHGLKPWRQRNSVHRGADPGVRHQA